MPVKRCRPWTPKVLISLWFTAPSHTWWLSIDDLQPEYATAYCAAFNDWLADYCGADHRRLKPAAIVSLHDPSEPPQSSTCRRAEGACGGGAAPDARDGRYFNAPECDVLWQEITPWGCHWPSMGTSGGASKDTSAKPLSAAMRPFRTLNHASSFPAGAHAAIGCHDRRWYWRISGALRVAFSRAIAAGCHGGCTVSTISGKNMRWRIHEALSPAERIFHAAVLHRH